jgi:hypothetical protein
VFASAISSVLKKYPGITGIPTIPATGRMSELKKWLTTQGITPDQIREMLDALKNELFNDLKPSDVDISYYDFLKYFSPLVCPPRGNLTYTVKPMLSEAV